MYASKRFSSDCSNWAISSNLWESYKRRGKAFQKKKKKRKRKKDYEEVEKELSEDPASEINPNIPRHHLDHITIHLQATARTLGSVWRSYLSPALDNYVVDPMRSYVLDPVRSYLYEPISDYVNDFAERIETWMDGSQRPYIDVQYPENYYRRWSERVNSYASRISDWASQARQGLEMARRMLEIQDEGRCYSCGDQDEHYLEDVNMYNVQVQELAWLAWLSAIGLLAVAAAIAIPPSVAIPVALGAGGAGGDLTGPPEPTFVAVQVPVIGVPPPPPGFPVAATGPVANPGAFIAADDGGFAFGPFGEPIGAGAGAGAGPNGGATGFGLGGGPGVGGGGGGAGLGGGATGANGFGTAPQVGAAPGSFIVGRRRKYSPYEHIDRSADEFDYSVLNERFVFCPYTLHPVLSLTFAYSCFK
ncbi:uncharacterized protein [Palaemon carinicauda]|uniref:uncharacterized protein n=1 Tax=Palaemon carinicauda TaxID=392227 RepID=UPI0035B5D849